MQRSPKGETKGCTPCTTLCREQGSGSRYAFITANVTAVTGGTPPLLHCYTVTKFRSRGRLLTRVKALTRSSSMIYHYGRKNSKIFPSNTWQRGCRCIIFALNLVGTFRHLPYGQYSTTSIYASNYQYIYIGNYHYVDKYLPITINLWVNSALSISTYSGR